MNLRQKAFLYFSASLVLSMVLTFVTTPAVLTYKTADEDFNAYLEKQDLKNETVVLNAVGPSTKNIKGHGGIVSHHAFSYKDRQGNLGLSGFTNFLLGATVENIYKTQYEDLSSQIAGGARSFDVRVSKDSDGKIVIDRSVIYGTPTEFIKELNASNPSGYALEVLYSKSPYSKQDMNMSEIKSAFTSTLPTGHKITVRETVRSETWAIVDSSEGRDIMGLLGQSNKTYFNLNEYRETGPFVTLVILTIVAYLGGFLFIGISAYVIKVMYYDKINKP